MSALTKYGASAVGLICKSGNTYRKDKIQVRIPQIHGMPGNTEEVSYYVSDDKLPWASIFFSIRPQLGSLIQEDDPTALKYLAYGEYNTTDDPFSISITHYFRHNEIVYVQFSSGDLAYPIIVGTTRKIYKGANAIDDTVLPVDSPHNASSNPYQYNPTSLPSTDDVWSKYVDDICKIGPSHYTARWERTVEAVVIHYTACRTNSGRAVVNGWNSNMYSSSNYIIDVNGVITGVVPEQLRAYTSSSWNDYSNSYTDIDNRAITIECSCDYVPPRDNYPPGQEGDYAWNYAIAETATTSQATLDSCVKLLGDIGNRYNIEWRFADRDTSGTIHAHFWYGATLCPGTYLYSKFPEIAQRAREATEQERQGG